jgi:hypothetical protein
MLKKNLVLLFLSLWAAAWASVSAEQEKEWTRLGFTAKSGRLGVSVVSTSSNLLLDPSTSQGQFQLMSGITRAYISASTEVDLIESDAQAMQAVVSELSKKLLDGGASGINAPAFRSVDRFINIQFPTTVEDNNAGSTNYNYVKALVVPAFGDRAAKPLVAYAPQPGGPLSASEAGELLGQHVLAILQAGSYAEAMKLSELSKQKSDIVRGFGDSMGISLSAFLGSVSSIAWTTLFAWDKNYEDRRSFVWGNYLVLGIPYSSFTGWALSMMNTQMNKLEADYERLRAEYISTFGKEPSI